MRKLLESAFRYQRALHWGFLLVLSGLCGCREELPPKTRSAAAAEPRVAEAAAMTASPRSLYGRRILLVHSYHPEYPWVDTITQGVRSALSDTGVELNIFYMDTKRHTDEAWKIDAGNRARAEVEKYRPDIVLAADDDAQNYFAKAYIGGSLPIVFTGVDSDPTRYGYPASNVTGVIERPHLRESITLAQRLRPIRRIAVLSCNDITSRVALGFMKQEHLDVEVTEWLLVDDFDQWAAAVARLNNTVDAIVIRSYQAVKIPGSRENVPPKQVAEWTAEHATVPTISFHDFEIRDGLLVGVVKSGQEYGRQMADYALRILAGTSPSTLPITRAKLGTPMINRDTAGRLGIILPPDLTVEVTVVSKE